MDFPKEQSLKYDLLVSGFHANTKEVTSSLQLSNDIIRIIHSYVGRIGFKIKELNVAKPENEKEKKKEKDQSIPKKFSAHDMFDNSYGPLITTSFQQKKMRPPNEWKSLVWQTKIGKFKFVAIYWFAYDMSDQEYVEEESERLDYDQGREALKKCADLYDISKEEFKAELQRNNISLWGLNSAEEEEDEVDEEQIETQSESESDELSDDEEEEEEEEEEIDVD